MLDGDQLQRVVTVLVTWYHAAFCAAASQFKPEHVRGSDLSYLNPPAVPKLATEHSNSVFGATGFHPSPSSPSDITVAHAETYCAWCGKANSEARAMLYY